MPMLFQTFLQLNILILATPALAGWSLLPPVHAGMVRAAGIVWQYRVVETPAPKAAVQASVRQATLPIAAAPRSVPAKPTVFAASCTAALAAPHPFPHAARAP